MLRQVAAAGLKLKLQLALSRTGGLACQGVTFKTHAHCHHQSRYSELSAYQDQRVSVQHRSERCVTEHCNVESSTVEGLIPLHKLPQALLHGCLGRIPQLPPCQRDVGVSPQHVARCWQRDVFPDGFQPHEPLQCIDDVRHIYRMLISQVVNLEGRVPIRAITGPVLGSQGTGAQVDVVHGSKTALNYVINVGEVTLQLAPSGSSEHGQRLPFQNVVSKSKYSHVRAPKRTINSEEPEPGKGDLVDVVVRVRQQLIFPLGCSIQAGGMIHCIGLGEWHLGVRAVHRAG
mmetsp:Transcript_107033/g.302663  ORF Transcript_107033/g.302663 Transcript_107033/m.302663 type:complete len:288 (+) Transcript_107033:250-1113(+)